MEESKPNADEKVLVGLETALEYIKEDLSEEIADAETLVSKGEVTFDLLWTLFPPNTYVCTYHEGTGRTAVGCAKCRRIYMGCRDREVALR